VGCEAGRIEGKSDFPEAFADFNCTLDLRLEHNVARACDHALSATEFEERKVIQVGTEPPPPSSPRSFPPFSALYPTLPL